MIVRLESKLAPLFDHQTKNRGRDYFRKGWVRIKRGTPQEVEALVIGGQNYKVRIVWRDRDLGLDCTCPYFESNGPCKHLWATVLAAQARDFLTEVPQFEEEIDLELEGNVDDFLGDFSLSPPPAPPPPTPAWKLRIEGVSIGSARGPARLHWPGSRQLIYTVESVSSTRAGNVVVSFSSRDLKKDGGYTRPKLLRLKRYHIPELPLKDDREILAALSGAISEYASYTDTDFGEVPAYCTIRHPLAALLVPSVVRTGRCYLHDAGPSGDLFPLTWDDGGPWRFELELQAAGKLRSKTPNQWLVVGVLRREDQTMQATDVTVATKTHIIANGMVAPLAEDTNFEWLQHLRTHGAIAAPASDVDDLLSTLLGTPGLPKLEVPTQLRYEEIIVSPRPCLRIRAATRRNYLDADLSFEYDGRMIPALYKAGGVYDAATRRFLRRDPAVEQEASNLLGEVGVKFRAATYYDPEGWELPPAKLPRVVRALVEAGWHIDADGKVFRRPGELRMEVSSGIDWFELHGDVAYGETSAKLPQLLDALRRGESMVKLDDGTYGILPEDWLKRIGMLAGMGTAENGHIRFRQSQVGLLDALLAAQPEAKFDAQFGRIREEMQRFHGVDAAEQPEGFNGRLRDYQREGVGWMHFLRRFSFGGCLADDMGVGKTAQVLALLEDRRASRQEGGSARPSLVVAPRSLIFNWKQEAERFTPQLRVLDYTGLSRSGADIGAFDLVLTTYGTVRRDAPVLKDVEFDYVVLDEAQAVKNAGTESSKAVRLLRGEHRLALSGTPVENHLGELWSLFEFLNPGMLGAASVFKLTSSAGRMDEETRGLLAHALRPFILRRTKEQVVRELPAKTEQTVYCELEPEQRKLYNELRQHYRDALLARIETQGLAKSKIMVLEALLRLRQAACHPGLIDAKRASEPSAKLEALQEQLREVLDSGHKALVFSQFTSLLAIVRERLDADGVVYEYLDGKTRDRQAHVERFQNDPDCKLFLVSLKAGGLGLNLTAAEYVFLLDPWWNPAVEAQAVDRAHRIGQTRPVFAYRLIARDTVEEKVLELQKTKRDLAAAIIGEDNALIRNLRREDLELLLS